ncbi:hypothetical protein K502DRAFT_341906 [Neoconidiobolus thromboides FSU 785]|nr:hypothetical protein K502DRAFT_341906 [Neoconidiobolus thromboides FSU 785]
MLANINFVALFISCSSFVYATNNSQCDTLSSIPIIRYSAGKPTDTKCVEGTGICGKKGEYYECKNNKYVRGECSCPDRYCTKKAMYIECEKKLLISPQCLTNSSLPITRYSEGKPEDKKCVENTGFCSGDGGYYECKNSKYIKSFCKCPHRICAKKALFIECERLFPVDTLCESAEPTNTIKYHPGKPNDRKCVEGTGFCDEEDGTYYQCKGNKYTKEYCQCFGRSCARNGPNIQCQVDKYKFNFGY